jgi:hypothetical protein
MIFIVFIKMILARRTSSSPGEFESPVYPHFRVRLRNKNKNRLKKALVAPPPSVKQPSCLTRAIDRGEDEHITVAS